MNSSSGNLLVFLLVVCVNNTLRSLCMIFEVVRIIIFFHEIYQHVYICVSYMHKYQRSDFSCRITERIYSRPSVIISLPEIYRHVWNCVSYIHTYQCLFIYWMFELKHLWYKDMYVNVMYHLLKMTLLFVLWCMTTHLKIKRNKDKFDIKAPILSTFKIFHVFKKQYPMIYTIGKISELL